MPDSYDPKVDNVNEVMAEDVNTLYEEMEKGTLLAYYANTETLSDDLVLTDDDLPIQFLDAGGTPRTVTMPALAATNHNTVFANIGGETLTIEDALAAEIGEVAAGEMKMFVSDGATGWMVMGGSGGGGAVPVKASAADALAGTDDEKFITPLSAKGLPSIYPDSTPDADHTTHGIKATFTANENQAFGDVCFINADGEMQIGDADAIATSKITGMCADATISADASGNYLLFGPARDDTWAWTPGGFVYLTVTGTTGNTLSQTAPTGADDCIVIVGVASHADRMIFNPQLVIVEHTG